MIEPFNESDTLEERIKKLSKANEGLINDLQSERSKRQEFETRLANLETEMTPEPEDNPTLRVNRLAANPDEYISDIVGQAMEKEVKPLQQTVVSLLNERKIEKAKRWIAKREGIDPDEVEDKFGVELIRIGKERGLVDQDPEQGIKNAYEIMLQDRKRKEEEEKARAARINGQSTETVMPSSSAAPQGAYDFTQSQIREIMRTGQYEQYREKILSARMSGRIKLDVQRAI